MEDPFKELVQKRNEKIIQHQECCNRPQFKEQVRRRDRLLNGILLGLQATWGMATRCPGLVDKSLTFRFLDDTLQAILAIYVMTKEGLVNPAKREMRYLLESSCKHYYVDSAKMGCSLPERLQFLKSNVPRSSLSFIDSLTLPAFNVTTMSDFLTDCKSLYSRLCQYVHPSPEQIAEYLRLSSKGISPGFESYKELQKLNGEASRLYDIVLILHFHSLGLGLAGDVFTVVLDGQEKWPFHRTKYVKKLSAYFDYKLERQPKEKEC